MDIKGLTAAWKFTKLAALGGCVCCALQAGGGKITYSWGLAWHGRALPPVPRVAQSHLGGASEGWEPACKIAPLPAQVPFQCLKVPCSCAHSPLSKSYVLTYRLWGEEWAWRNTIVANKITTGGQELLEFRQGKMHHFSQKDTLLYFYYLQTNNPEA